MLAFQRVVLSGDKDVLEACIKAGGRDLLESILKAATLSDSLDGHTSNNNKNNLAYVMARTCLIILSDVLLKPVDKNLGILFVQTTLVQYADLSSMWQSMIKTWIDHLIHKPMSTVQRDIRTMAPRVLEIFARNFYFICHPKRSLVEDAAVLLHTTVCLLPWTGTRFTSWTTRACS
jgi:hypothetical protein